MVHRIKSDVKGIPVKDVAGQTIDTIRGTDSLKISTVTINAAFAEIRKHVPDLSGYKESEVRRSLLEEYD